MSKKFLPLFLLFYIISFQSFSQDFLGLSTGNYAGITGVSLQPASIVDSRFKFDINLISTDVNYSNNYFLLDRDLILKFNKNKFDDYNTFKDRYLTEASLGTGERVFFNINSRTQLPLSFMATTGKKSAIALNMQFRTMIQGRGITQDFASLAFNNFNPTTSNPSIDASRISINSLSWAEAGLTYGRVLYSSGEHFLKAAVTAKYLAGLSSVSLSANDLQMRVNSDSTFNFNSPNVSYNHNRNADFNKIFDRNFSPDANAIGFDAGLVYEYRGNIDKFKYIRNDETSHDNLRRDVNKYIFKVGVSLLDVGMFQFDKPTDVNSFSANINNWDIKNAHYNSIKEFDTALAARVMANPNDPSNYNVYLPSALSAQLDVKFVKGLFLNVMSYWPVELGSSPGKRFNKYGFYTITPRYETRHFGIYIPYTVTQRNDFTDYKEHLLGATIRLGPLFFGSSNLGSMLFNNRLRAADFHIGLKIGVTYGNPNKSNKFLNTIFKKNQEVEFTAPEKSEEKYSREPERVREKAARVREKDSDGQSKLILDYKEGKVYDNPDVKQNVIIINNTYYGNLPGQMRTDTATIQTSFPKYNADSLKAIALENLRKENKRIADSISKRTIDSLKIKRTQLDSLIRSMQQLQIQMDSINRIEGGINDDSPVSYNPAEMEILKDHKDSLENANKILQANSRKSLLASNMNQDTAQADSSAQTRQFLTIKKKDKSEQDSILSRNESDSMISTDLSQKTDRKKLITDSSVALENQSAINREKLQQMQDSLDLMSKRYSDITDSNNREKLQQMKDSLALMSKKKSDITDSDNRERLQQMQDSMTLLSKRYSDITDSDNRKKLQQIQDSMTLLSKRYSDITNSNKPEKLQKMQDSLALMSKRYSDITDSDKPEKLQQMQDSLDRMSKRYSDITDSDNRGRLQQMQDSLALMSKRYADFTDSLMRENSVKSARTENAVLLDENKNVPATARMQEMPNQSNSNEIQRMQEHQNELFRQYANQANALKNDIDRLNSRLTSERNYERRAPGYIPVPIPMNNSRQQAPVEVAIPNKADTIYIRDTVRIRDTLSMRDTIARLPEETRNPLRVLKESKPITVVKEFIQQPDFDFSSMPEENILFAIGKSIIQPNYDSKLNFIAGILVKNPGLKVLITGHTDATGSKAINEKLSLQRAQSVADYLTGKGLSEKQIILKSQSFENPAVSGNSQTARSQNRRVTLKFVNLKD